ncbi:MAG: helix-turn-helix domain-containing protein [Lachnospiraceae bacterium]|nr:helix-turn-helix domain-containing protein [Lachnospiraceae bacterium]
MIVYNDVLQKLSACGWSTYRLIKEKVIGNETISHIRSGKPISTSSIDTICRLCKCQPGDILRWEPDE